jgi:hypothetical protein
VRAPHAQVLLETSAFIDLSPPCKFILSLYEISAVGGAKADEKRLGQRGLENHAIESITLLKRSLRGE